MNMSLIKNRLFFLALTVARCIAICKPLKSHIILTHHKAKKHVIFVLIGVLAINIPFIFAYTLNEVPNSSGNATSVYQCNSIKGE